MNCSKCGAQFEGKFCPECGAAAAAEAGSQSEQPPSQAQPPQQAAAGSGLEENVASTLCYVFIGAIIFLVLEPYNKNKNIRFHAFQAIFTFLGLIAISFGLMIMSAILPWWMTAPVWMVYQLGTFVLWIFLLVKTYQNQKIVLPVVGPLAEKQA